MEGLYNLTNHGVRKAEAPWWCTLWWTNIALEMKSCYYIGKSSINNRCFIVMVYCRSQLRLPAIHRCNVLASRPPTKLLRLRLRKGCRKNGDFTSSLSNRDMNAVDRYKNYSIPYTSSYIYILLNPMSMDWFSWQIFTGNHGCYHKIFSGASKNVPFLASHRGWLNSIHYRIVDTMLIPFLVDFPIKNGDFP